MAPKVVLITGCSAGGIGYDLAERMATLGCRVIATARRVEAMAGLDAVGCKLMSLDVTDAKQVQEVVQEVVATEGRIDVLVNNAGSNARGTAVDTPPSLARSIFETNVWGVVALTQAVAPHMIAARSGTIVNVASVAAYMPIPAASSYCASKAAARAWTNVLRLELAPFGVHVVLVSPGLVRTRMTSGQGGTMAVAAPPPRSPYAHMASFLRLLSLNQFHGPAAEQAATSSVDFAATVVPQLLRASPPREVVAGRMGWVVVLLSRILPGWLVELIVVRNYKLQAAPREAAPAIAAAAAAAATGAIS